MRVDAPQAVTENNVIAELPGSSGSVVMAGAHLGSVRVGPGSNYGGSGSAVLLDVAEQMAKVKPRNTVRLAWWGAHEGGLVGSPNHVFFTLDGDDSEDRGFGSGPEGSAGGPRDPEVRDEHAGDLRSAGQGQLQAQALPGYGVRSCRARTPPDRSAVASRRRRWVPNRDSLPLRGCCPKNGTVQVEVDVSRLIARPPSEVFPVLADIQRYAAAPGSPVLVMVKEPSGPTGLGTAWREVVRLGPLVSMTIHSTVTAIEQDRRLAMDFHSRAFRGCLEYVLEPVDCGTRLRQRQALQPHWWLRPLAGPIVRRFAGRVEARLVGIGALVESEGHVPEPGAGRAARDDVVERSQRSNAPAGRAVGVDRSKNAGSGRQQTWTDPTSGQQVWMDPGHNSEGSTQPKAVELGAKRVDENG